MERFKLGNVKAQKVTPTLLKLRAPWWFQGNNLQRALILLEEEWGYKISWILRMPPTWFGLPYLLVGVEETK